MNMPGASKRIFEIVEPKILLCLTTEYGEIVDALTKMNLKPKIYTMDGVVDDSESAEKLLEKTGCEDEFS